MVNDPFLAFSHKMSLSQLTPVPGHFTTRLLEFIIQQND